MLGFRREFIAAQVLVRSGALKFISRGRHRHDRDLMMLHDVPVLAIQAGSTVQIDHRCAVSFGALDRTSRSRTVPPALRSSTMTPSHRHARASIVMSLLLLVVLVKESHSESTQTEQKPEGRLTHVSLEDLGQIEVTTASKEPVKASRTPAAIYVITQEDIRRSGATSIPEVLRLAPGVEVARVDSNTWSLGIRGFGSALSRSVLVLIDGRSVYTPLFAGVYWQVQDTVLEDIERIEVIRGPGGTIWGANAVNGVINIITKSTKDTHGMLASVSGGSVDQGIAEVRVGGGNGKGFDYRVYGKGFIRGSEFHPDGSNFDHWKTGQLGFRTDWNLNERDSLTLQGDMYQGLDGERVAISLYTPPSRQVFNGPHDVAGCNILGRWRRQFS